MKLTICRFPIITLLIPLMIFSVCSCHSPSPTEEKLYRIQSIMDARPDSARMMLDSLDLRNLDSGETALYALLDAQSRHKLEMPVPCPDSLLNISISRYASHGPDSMLMKSLFYRAAYYFENGDYEASMKDVLRSLEVAKKLKNHYWHAKTAELIGDLLFDFSNFQEELKWRMIAAKEYKAAGRMDNYLFTMVDINTAHLNLHDSARAIALNDSLRRVIEQYPEIPHIRAYHAYSTLFIFNAYGTVDKADSAYRVLLKYEKINEKDPSVQLARATILLRRGKYEESRRLLDSLKNKFTNPGGKDQLYAVYSRLADKMGSLEMKKQWTDSLIRIQFVMVSDGLAQSLVNVQKEFYKDIAKQKTEEKKMTTLKAAVTICVFIVILAVVIFKFRRRTIRKNLLMKESEERYVMLEKELEERIADNDAFKEGMRKKEKDLDLLKEKEETGRESLFSVYRSKWITMNMLCSEILNHEKKTPGITLSNIRKHIEKIKGPNLYRSLEEDLNIYYKGLISRLRRQCPGLNEADIDFCILKFAGLSLKAISVITETPLSSLYSRRGRLETKIRKQDPEDGGLFLSLLRM